MKTWAILLLALITGCAGIERAAPPPVAPLFSDARFKAPSETVDAGSLFSLSPEMRSYLRSPGFSAQLRHKGYGQGLVDALYQKRELKIEYDSAMTRTAAQTFAARTGNCLSLVIMTAAFAKELGMPVQYQSVEVGESWSRNGGLYLVSTHVNLSLGQRPFDVMGGADARRILTVDFLAPEDVRGYRSFPLTEGDIIAMYMNNRAAEALVSQRIDDAYWWARAAVAQHPSSIVAYNTLGVVYQRHGDAALAERVFRAALEREPENLVIMQNLVPVLVAVGKGAEAQALSKRIASIEPFPPFHFFNLGMTALQSGDYKEAKALFGREVRRAPYYDEFHFWLAVACLRLGDARQAREQLALALDNSTTRSTRDLYAAKLAHLRTLDTARGALH